jgi:hypothetical protein
LEVKGWAALNMRWLWLRKTQPTRPWPGLEIQVHPKLVALFAVSICTVVRDGASTLFWTYRWIQGKFVVDLAPELVAAVPARFRKLRTVHEKLSNGIWINDVRNDLSDIAFLQFTCIWTTVQDIQVQDIQLVPGVVDLHIWTPSSSGTFSSKSAYERFFVGAVNFEPADRIWKTWAPTKCKFFLWLAALNRCWTVDRLAKRGLEHLERCPLCDQEDETVQHLLTSCVFARETWAHILSKVGLQHLLPSSDVKSFQVWWRSSVDAAVKKGFNSLVALGAWWI